MNNQVRLLSVLLLCTINGLSYGQNHADSVPSPSYSNVKWLYKQGFPVSNYEWNNSEINLHLTKALKYHRRAKFFDGASIGLAGAGVLLLTAGFGGYLFEIATFPLWVFSEYQTNAELYNILIVAGGVSLGGGVALVLGGGGSNRKRANAAARCARLKFFSNRQSLIK